MPNPPLPPKTPQPSTPTPGRGPATSNDSAEASGTRSAQRPADRAQVGTTDGVNPPAPATALPAYVELHCLTNYSFLRGASHASELVARAKALDYAALAITDECSLAGVVRAHVEAKEQGLPILIGSEFWVEADTPFRLVVLARNRAGYARLCLFITRLRMATAHKDKGSYRLAWDDIDPRELDDCVLLAAPQPGASFESVFALAHWLRANRPDDSWLAVELLRSSVDAAWQHKLAEVSRLTGVPLVAAGDVHMHVRSRKPLHDVLTATRLNTTVAEAGEALEPHAERHLRSRLQLSQIYPKRLLAETLEVARRCTFNLDELAYEYPDEVVPPGSTPAAYLREITYKGANEHRYKQGIPEPVRKQIEWELHMIAEMDYEKYFLTVYDIVRFAREQAILCQGRGSAANSAVCYCLGITEVDPSRGNLLFERFISKERNEPPDIDVDFEHQRRETVIQYIYAKYGRHRTALAATVISYRTRSAVRDVGKALGFTLDQCGELAQSHQWWDAPPTLALRLSEVGLDANDRAVQQWMALTMQLIGFPRHLSQHVGGFVIARGTLSEMVPIENASMQDRSVIQWDKDDLEALRLMKVDVLALGMLSAIRRSLDFISERRGHRFEMQDIPAQDEPTYRMIRKADTVGVFQIESRAQMGMLPRLKPAVFYDLVVQVAIVRPGPIQGGMVHPFLNSRMTGVPVPYPPELEPALKRTNGVPIFQEQVMQIVMLGAGFSPGEADQLRRAMAAWKRKGGLLPFHDRIVDGMTERGHPQAFAESIFEMIKGFGEYGFPESHAASFALLAYVSSWIKCHEPAAFLAAMINSQPMGFYTASQLVQDARRHDVTVLPVDVVFSGEEAMLVDARCAGQPPVRLGLNSIVGLGETTARQIVRAREMHPFASVDDLSRRARLDNATLRRLAAADALQSLSGHRRQQVWEASALHATPELLRDAPVEEMQLALPEAPEGEEILFDYASTGMTLRRHPLSLLRPMLRRHRYAAADELMGYEDGRLASACGIVTLRQQPETAKGTIFVSIEDETGTVNVIVWKSLREKQRVALLSSRMLGVHGVWQSRDGVTNLVAHRLEDHSPWLGRLDTTSRNFR
jgi:error-prone DNA polymerase